MDFSKRILSIFLAFSAILCFSCGGCGSDSEDGTEEQTTGSTETSGSTDSGSSSSASAASAVSYVTTADKSKLFESEDLTIYTTSSMSTNRITLDTTTTYQSITGFGAAMTGASCYNLLLMSQSDRTAFLKEMFDVDEGLGVSLVRMSIGSSDFGMDEYTHCDTEGIDNFAIHKYDTRDVIPILKEVREINPDVKIIGTPWTCPRWMKLECDSDAAYYSWTSGRLNPDYYDDYAQYFVKWIQAMEDEGLDIYAITVQNEPLNKGNSMSLYMTWEEERDFIKNSLGPAFEAADIGTKILIFDHNYDYDSVSGQDNYALNILADSEAAQYIAGSAWHNYSGDVSELDNIQAGAPDKEIYFTEASIGSWNYDFSSCLINDYEDIFIETLLRGNSGVTLWNLMLDEDNGPHRGSGACSTCYGVVTLGSDYTVTSRQTHYYNIAHASKVVRQDAVRIGTSGTSALSYVAFQNPDGSYGIMILNSSSSDVSFALIKGSKNLRTTAPATSLLSILWKN